MSELLLGASLVDTFRALYPQKPRFTWGWTNSGVRLPVRGHGCGGHDSWRMAGQGRGGGGRRGAGG